MGSSMTGKSKVPSGYKEGKLNNFSPEQMKLFQSMFGRLGPNSFLGKLASGNQSQFQQMEAPALRQFNQFQEGIANRYSGSGRGEMSSRNSSGFYNEQNAAASDLAEKLQGSRTGLQYNAVKDLMGLSDTLLNQRSFNSFLAPKEKKKSFWGNLLGGAATVGGAALGGFYGGPTGAKLGAGIGSSFGYGFGY